MFGMNQVAGNNSYTPYDIVTSVMSGVKQLTHHGELGCDVPPYHIRAAMAAESVSRWGGLRSFTPLVYTMEAEAAQRDNTEEGQYREER